MSKKKQIVFSEQSVADLQRINEFYSSIEVHLRKKAFDRLIEAFELLESYPFIGKDHLTKKLGKELVLPFGKGNFYIRYLVKKDTINISHIWHSLEDESF